MPILYKPSKYETIFNDRSLTEPEHANELTPQAIIRKLQAGIVGPPGIFGYEDCSLDYIKRKQLLAQTKIETESLFKKMLSELKDKNVKYKIPKTFDEFLDKQHEFSRFAAEFVKQQNNPGESTDSAGKPPTAAPSSIITKEPTNDKNFTTAQ